METGLVCLIVGICGAPGDEALIANFYRNRAQFETLREKVCTLSDAQAVMMDPEWSRPEISATDRKWDHTIFKAIGAKGVQATPKPCGIWVEMWSVGLGGNGDYKMYRFGAPVQEPMIDVTDLDAVDLASDKIAFYQSRIEGDWWLELDHWP